MDPPKETNKAPVTNPPKIEICELPAKSCKVIISKEAQLHAREHGQLNKIRKTMYEHLSMVIEMLNF